MVDITVYLPVYIQGRQSWVLDVDITVYLLVRIQYRQSWELDGRQFRELCQFSEGPGSWTSAS